MDGGDGVDGADASLGFLRGGWAHRGADDVDDPTACSNTARWLAVFLTSCAMLGNRSWIGKMDNEEERRITWSEVAWVGQAAWASEGSEVAWVGQG